MMATSKSAAGARSSRVDASAVGCTDIHGHERRRARTRAALVSAALGFLVEGRTDVAVQEITEAAGVGQGSFYNHFVSKEALYDAALE